MKGCLHLLWIQKFIQLIILKKECDWSHTKNRNSRNSEFTQTGIVKKINGQSCDNFWIFAHKITSLKITEKHTMPVITFSIWRCFFLTELTSDNLLISAWNYTVFCRIAVSAVAMTSFWCDFGKKLYDSRHRCFAWNCTVFCRIFAEFLRALVDRWGYSAKNCTIPDETLQPGFVQFFAEIGIFPPFWVVLITKPQ